MEENQSKVRTSIPTETKNIVGMDPSFGYRYRKIRGNSKRAFIKKNGIEIEIEIFMVTDPEWQFFKLQKSHLDFPIRVPA